MPRRARFIHDPTRAAASIRADTPEDQAERLLIRDALARAGIDADAKFPTITPANYAEAVAFQASRFAYWRDLLRIHYSQEPKP